MHLKFLTTVAYIYMMAVQTLSVERTEGVECFSFQFVSAFLMQ
jgi:hypothetical protein